MKRIVIISSWIVLIIYSLLISGFVTAKHRELFCNELNVIITDSMEHSFLNREDIFTTLERNEINVLGEVLDDINTWEVENVILKNSMVKQCEVYKTSNGKLNCKIEQREPILRIIDSRERSYFIDSEGTIIKLSKRYIPRLLVFNGYINTMVDLSSTINIYSEEHYKKTRRLREIHQLTLFINGDEFWRSQIVQVYINADGEYELVPRVGPHIIELGDISDFEEKFWKLKVLYKEGLSRKGWNNYLKINLKYKNQVVCTKI